MLENVAVHDDVEGPFAIRDLAVKIHLDHPLAMTGAGLRERRIALDRRHAPALIRELAAQQTVRGADVEQPAAASVAQPAQDDRVAAMRVCLEDGPWPMHAHRIIWGPTRSALLLV